MANLPTLLTTEFDSLVEIGDLAGAALAIAEGVRAGLAEALFLSSTISSSAEPLSDFEKRSLEQVCKSASLGYAPAQFRLGCYLRFGDFLDKDVVRAVDLFRKSAITGFPPAMYEYGLALLHGEGAEREPAEGMRWIRRSADEGDAAAVEFLAGVA